MPSRSKQSNENLLYNELRNVSMRVNAFGDEVAELSAAAQANSIDIEQLVNAVEQLRSRLDYLEALLKEARQSQ